MASGRSRRRWSHNRLQAAPLWRKDRHIPCFCSQYVKKHGDISRPQAYRLLKKQEGKGHLTQIGTKGRSVKYERNTKENAR